MIIDGHHFFILRGKIVLYPLRKVSLIAVFATLLGLAQACIAETTGIPFPKPSEGFQPKVTYNFDKEKSWSIVLAALDNNSIPIASASKDVNLISTDSMVGPGEKAYWTGLQMTQYKYKISVVPISPSQTKINVNPTIEVLRRSTRSTDNVWHNVTAENPQEVTALRNWLYEQIERSIK